MNLIEWTSVYIDHVNSFKRNIEEKKVEKNKVVCQLKNKNKLTYYISHLLSKDMIKEGLIVLVCLNIKANLDFTLENWNLLIKNPKLKIMFVNPKENSHWSLIPNLHDKISDEKSLKKGLKSLFESIPEAAKPF